MRHQRLRRKLGVTSDHRKALLRNLVKSLVERKRIRTTLARAKEASAFADKMVTLAKKNTLHAHRQIISELACPKTAGQLVKVIGPKFKDRVGGYTRVLRLMPRPGDNSKMALLEFTEVIDPPKKPKKAVKASKGTKAVKEETVVAEKPEVKKPEKASKTKPEAEKAPEVGEEKKETEKKGGFLGSLRKFLKGDE